MPQLIYYIYNYFSRKLAEPKLQLTLKPKDAVVDPNIELAQKVALQEEVEENILFLPALSQSTVNTQESTRVPIFNENEGTTLCTNSTELNQKERVEMDHPNPKIDTEAKPFQTTALALTKYYKDTYFNITIHILLFFLEDKMKLKAKNQKLQFLQILWITIRKELHKMMMSSWRVNMHKF